MQLVIGARRLGQDAEPAPGIDDLMLGPRRRRDRLPARPVEPVAADQKIAMQLLGRAVAVAKRDPRVLAVDPVQRHLPDRKDDRAARGQARGNQILDHFVLRVDDNPLAAGQLDEIDVMAAPVELKGYSGIEAALAHHPGTEPHPVHQVDDPLLEDPGADRAFDFGAAAILDDDGVDARAMQEVR